MKEAPALTVFYDGACPLCDREISFYKRRRGAEDVSWIDVSGTEDGEVAPGLPKDQALARFHVMQSDGTLVSGGGAFAELWTALPGFRPWGRLFRTRPFTWLLKHAYVLFLGFRPRIQALMIAQAAKGIEVFPTWLLRDLRSDHAGETGAVAIYRGILAVSRSDEVRSFAKARLQTEKQHLQVIESVLSRSDRSGLLPLWRFAGFLTGAIPAFFGAKAVFATIAAVEAFVDRHYAGQIDRLSKEDGHKELIAVLQSCRHDEVRHREEALQLMEGDPGAFLRAWFWLVGAGSAAAVVMARRI